MTSAPSLEEQLDELRSMFERQEEKITRQEENLTQQAEKLTQQAEKLTQQAEKITELTSALARSEFLDRASGLNMTPDLLERLLEADNFGDVNINSIQMYEWEGHEASSEQFLDYNVDARSARSERVRSERSSRNSVKSQMSTFRRRAGVDTILNLQRRVVNRQAASGYISNQLFGGNLDILREVIGHFSAFLVSIRRAFKFQQIKERSWSEFPHVQRIFLKFLQALIIRIDLDRSRIYQIPLNLQIREMQGIDLTATFSQDNRTNLEYNGHSDLFISVTPPAPASASATNASTTSAPTSATATSASSTARAATASATATTAAKAIDVVNARSAFLLEVKDCFGSLIRHGIICFAPKDQLLCEMKALRQKLAVKPDVFAGCLSDLFSLNIIFSLQVDATESFLLLDGVLAEDDFVLYLLLALCVNNQTKPSDLNFFLIQPLQDFRDDVGKDENERTIDVDESDREDDESNRSRSSLKRSPDFNHNDTSRKKRAAGEDRKMDNDCDYYADTFDDDDDFYPTLLFKDIVSEHACAHRLDPIESMYSSRPIMQS
jgi:hypothetical protein